MHFRVVTAKAQGLTGIWLRAPLGNDDYRSVLRPTKIPEQEQSPCSWSFIQLSAIRCNRKFD